MEDFAPPHGPPPLLTEDEVSSLCRQGWLLYDLPGQLKAKIDELNVTAKNFFALDRDIKVSRLGGKNHEEEGWFSVPDEKQYVTFRKSLTGKSALEREASVVWAEVTALLHRILCDLSRAGGLPLHAWNGILDGSKSFPSAGTDLRDVTSLMRLFQYLPETGSAAQHTDLGLLTLCVGAGKGLEVLDRWQQSQTWIDGSKCCILTGETLRQLSQGNIAAGLHRVVGNPEGRQSFVFALRPNLSSVVDLSHFGGEGTASMRSIFTEIKGSKYNVNATKEVREQQKEKQREKREQAQDRVGIA